MDTLGTGDGAPTFLMCSGRGGSRSCSGLKCLLQKRFPGLWNRFEPAFRRLRQKANGFFAMNNSSLTSADTSTHLKVVVVSLIAGILVIGIGIAASPTVHQNGVNATRMEATGPVIRAGKPISVSAGEAPTIR